MKCSSSGNGGKPWILQRRVFVHNHLLGTDNNLPDFLHHSGEVLEGTVLFGNDLLPVPLVDIATVVVVEKIVLPDRAHVRVDTFMNIAFKLLQRPAFPLGRCLYDRSMNRFIDTQATT